MEPAIRIRDLTVRYGGFTAVDGLCLTVARGEVLGFLGPNGAGKSSTIRTLLDLHRPTGGEVHVLGLPVRGGAGELRRRMGFLPGDFAPFPWLTGRETLDLFARLTGREPVLRDDVLRRLGLPTEALGRKVGTYSTGMRQMIGITAAFQHDPEVLVLDEPTTGLDPVVRDAFLELVREAPARGATVLLSSHVLAEVEACAHRVALIDRGRLLLVDDLATLRRDLPRQVEVVSADGTTDRFTHRGPPGELLAELAARDGVVDVVVRPSGLADVVRDVLRRQAPTGEVPR